MAELQAQAPPGTVGIFFGEAATAGNGWEVKMPDGKTERVYLQLPEKSGVTSTWHLAGAPSEHDGKPITDTSVSNLGLLYLTALRKIVQEFGARFSTT